MKQRSLLIFIFIFFSLPVFSVLNSTGRVIGAQSNQPIGYVSVALYNAYINKSFGDSLMDEDRLLKFLV